MITAEDGFSILVDTIKGEKYHQDYDHVVKLADTYKKLITGDKIDQLLRQFVRREDEVMFEQRKIMTQAITPSVSASLMSPFYKVGRVNSVIKKIDFNNTESIEEKIAVVEKAIKEYNGERTLDKYLETRLVDLNFCDPNSFIVTEFDPVALGPLGEMTDKPKPRPFEVSSCNAINYEYKNNILQWLVVRMDIKVKYSTKEIPGYSYTIYLENEAIRFTQVDENNVSVIMGQEIQYETLDGVKTFYRISEKKAFLVERFESNSGKIPAVRVGYKLDLITDGRTCVNPMHDAMPYFMKSIKSVSEFDLTMSLHAFPQKFQYANRCQGASRTTTCDLGRTPEGAICGVCKGSGYAIHTTAQDAVTLTLPKNKEDAYDLSGLVHYPQLPIELLKFQNDYIRELRSSAWHSVYNSEYLNKTETASTATEMNINMSYVYDTLFPFAQKFSQVYIEILSVVSKFVDVNDILITHQFPKDFKFKSVAELLAELKVATESGAPGYVRQEISMDIAEQQFVDKPEEFKKIRVKQRFYPFADKTPTEIVYILGNDLTTEYNRVLWSNFENIFISLESDAEELGQYFYDYTYKKQKELIDVKVEGLIVSIEDSKPETSIPFNQIIDNGGVE